MPWRLTVHAQADACQAVNRVVFKVHVAGEKGVVAPEEVLLVVSSW